jgi:hypothetical protein
VARNDDSSAGPKIDGLDAQTYLLLKTAFDACDIADGDADGLISGTVAALILHCLVHGIRFRALLDYMRSLGTAWAYGEAGAPGVGGTKYSSGPNVSTAMVALQRGGNEEVEDPYSDDEDPPASDDDGLARGVDLVGHLSGDSDPYKGQYRVGSGGAHVRTGAKLNSSKAGDLQPGETIEVYESELLAVGLGSGTVRLRFEREGGPAIAMQGGDPRWMDPNCHRLLAKGTANGTARDGGWVSIVGVNGAPEKNDMSMHPIVERVDGQDVGGVLAGGGWSQALDHLAVRHREVEGMQLDFHKFAQLAVLVRAHPKFDHDRMVAGVHEALSAANLYRSCDRRGYESLKLC